MRDAVTHISVFSVILPAIGQVLNFDAGAALGDVIRLHPEYFLPPQHEDPTDGDGKPVTPQDQLVLGQIKSNLISQQLALELLTNICSDNTVGDEWEDVGDMEEDDGENSGPSSTAMEGQQGAKETPSASGDLLANSPILLQLALQRALFAAPEIYVHLCQSLRGKELVGVMGRVQLRAVSALNNLAIGLPTAKLPGAQQWWTQLIEVGTRSTSTPGVSAADLLEEVTGTCWSLARNHPIVCDLSQLIATCLYLNLFLLLLLSLQTPTAEHLEALKGGARHSMVEKTRVNCVGTLGLFASSTTSPDICEAITSVLLTSLADPSLWVIAESLNAIFDVYGDKDKNAVFVKLGVLGILGECRQRIEPLVNAPTHLHPPSPSLNPSLVSFDRKSSSPRRTATSMAAWTRRW